MSIDTTTTPVETANGVGTSPRRPDGTVKVRGEFAYSSDLWHEDMLWGATLRSRSANDGPGALPGIKMGKTGSGIGREPTAGCSK